MRGRLTGSGEAPDTIPAGEFEVKDSGKRMEFESGMVRDVTEGKTRFDLAYDGPMFVRWAEHLSKGAEKYDARNWMQAEGDAELQRFRESAARHFMQWYLGYTDEDHAAAVFFNINGAEYVRERRGYPEMYEVEHAVDVLSRLMESGQEIGWMVEKHRYPDLADGFQ